MKKILLGLTLLILTACNPISTVILWGGSADIKLPKGEKLVNVSWKDNNLWVLTKPMSNKDSVEVYKFIEYGNKKAIEKSFYVVEER